MKSRADILRWVKEEIVSEIADMGGDSTRRHWWNEAASLLNEMIDTAIENPDMETSEDLRRAMAQRKRT